MVNLVLPEQTPEESPSESKKIHHSRNFGKIGSYIFIAVIIIFAIMAVWYAYANGLISLPKAQVQTSPTASNSAQPEASNSARLLSPKPIFSTNGVLEKGHVAFTRDDSRDPNLVLTDIWLVDKGGQKQLTHASGQGSQDRSFFDQPIILPTQSKVVYLESAYFAQSLETNYKIHIINWDGTGDRVIYQSKFIEHTFDVSSDEKTLLVREQDPNTSKNQAFISQVEIVSGKVTRKVGPVEDVLGCGCAGSGSGGLAIQVVGGCGHAPVLGWLSGNNYLYPTGCTGDTFKLTDDSGKIKELQGKITQPKASLDTSQFVGVLEKSIYLYQSDGKLLKKIDLKDTPTNALLSQDKKSIYFVTEQETELVKDKSGQVVTAGKRNSVWKINSDGTGQTKVFDDNSYLILLRKISGDGGTVIFDLVTNDLEFVKKSEAGVTSNDELAKVAPRVDIYTWNVATGARTKIVENGYQADYTSR